MKNENRSTQSNSYFIESVESTKLLIRELRGAGATAGEIIEFLKEMFRSGADVTPEQAHPNRRTMYTATKIARKHGVYSMYGRPHAHAISAILNFHLWIGDVHREEVILFQTDSITVYYYLYDEYALRAVGEWLRQNGMPDEVDGYCYTYQMRYKSKD